MELHQLRYMVAIARAGTFCRAAEQCHISQPSLSQQIQKLENELGERLFDRTKRKTQLTSHGTAFLQRAVRILEEVEAAKREASDAKTMVAGELRLGILPTIAPYLLPEIMRSFTKDFPAVQIIVQEDTTKQLVEQLHACDLDMAIVSDPIDGEKLRVEQLFEEDLLLAVPSDHPLAKRPGINTRDLDNERLIVMKEGHCLGDQVLKFCDRRALKPTISFRSGQLETVRALVCSGMGVSLIPEMAATAREGKSPVYRPFLTPKPTRTILAIWPTIRPPGRAAMELLTRIRALSPQAAKLPPAKKKSR